jgi:large subunit ribosomal protein L35Ae
MKGTIVNFRSSPHRQTDNQMVILPEGVETMEKAEKLVGKEVVYTTESGKEIKGKISAAHGSKGAVRAIFERGMPGQSLSKKVDIK